MKTRKIIKLINNERVNRKVSVRKACDATSIDICEEFDFQSCTVSSTDICIKDLQGACANSSYDSCTRDYVGCDNASNDYCAALSDVSGCIGANMTDY